MDTHHAQSVQLQRAEYGVLLSATGTARSSTRAFLPDASRADAAHGALAAALQQYARASTVSCDASSAASVYDLQQYAVCATAEADAKNDPAAGDARLACL